MMASPSKQLVVNKGSACPCPYCKPTLESDDTELLASVLPETEMRLYICEFAKNGSGFHVQIHTSGSAETDWNAWKSAFETKSLNTLRSARGASYNVVKRTFKSICHAYTSYKILILNEVA
ncbi:hypothetical protein CAPTEDRAFT_210218 [Capitella teleta]|uniref:Uncharacterized protein n=1 Tax=Capitella teleta TaxID=283909 RepID=R7TQ75_CAPTE|nr:hypothetical protein CAPTEDRAFT_210218 [Capitella teleta]|eukprot:ELT95717.1 hypothetical protein CAPTEDRAFT_210218 [Capitella teleta]